MKNNIFIYPLSLIAIGLSGFDAQVERSTQALFVQVAYTINSTKAFLEIAESYENNNPIGIHTLTKDDIVTTKDELLKSSIKNHTLWIDNTLFYVNQFIRCKSPRAPEFEKALFDLALHKAILVAKGGAIQEKEERSSLMMAHAETYHKHRTSFTAWRSGLTEEEKQSILSLMKARVQG
jgi:hypothetical protein